VISEFYDEIVFVNPSVRTNKNTHKAIMFMTLLEKLLLIHYLGWVQWTASWSEISSQIRRKTWSHREQRNFSNGRRKCCWSKPISSWLRRRKVWLEVALLEIRCSWTSHKARRCACSRETGERKMLSWKWEIR